MPRTNPRHPLPVARRAALLAVLLTTCLLAAAQPSATAQETEAALERGRALTKQLYAGDAEAVVAALDQQMLTLLQGEAGVIALMRDIDAQLGEESELISERVERDAGYLVYLRIARFTNYPGVIEVLWAFDSDWQVAGFYVAPQQEPEAAPSNQLEYETRAALRLPFEGDWYVHWGGRELEQNYHAASVDQRFALDLVVRRGGSTHAGSGTENTDYYCFGEPILAPAAGAVVAATGDLPDNTPGLTDPAAPAGNHVIIDHGEGEYSVIAHLKRGSLRVAPGDALEAGEQVGECGNSGNSSEPHLHYHLQTTPELNAGEGLPAQFQNYLADGELVERGEPVRGQTITPEKRATN